MITLNRISFSGITNSAKPASSFERKMSFKGEEADKLCLTKPTEEELQREFDNIFVSTKRPDTIDEVYNEHYERFYSGIKSLNDNYNSGKVNEEFVNENLKYLAGHGVKRLHPSEWKGAIATVFETTKPNQKNTNNVYKSISEFIGQANRGISNNDLKGKDKVENIEKIFTPKDMFNIFIKVTKAIEPIDIKNVKNASEERITGAKKACWALANNIKHIHDKDSYDVYNGKKMFYSVLNVLKRLKDKDDKCYYTIIQYLAASAVHLESDQKPEAINSIIQCVNQKNPSKEVDKTNKILKETLTNLYRPSAEEDFKSVKYKLDEIIEQRKTFLENLSSSPAKKEDDNTLSLKESKEDEMQREFDNIYTLKEANRQISWSMDDLDNIHQDIFDSGIKFLNDNYNSGKVSGKFVNKNLQHMVENTLPNLNASKWKDAIDTTFATMKQKETNANSVYKSIASFMAYSDNIEDTYSFVFNEKERKHLEKGREFLPPNEILEVFNKIVELIKPENTKDMPEQDTSATDVCTSLVCNIGFLPSKNRKHAFYSLMGIIKPEDEKYYEALRRLSITATSHLKKQHKLDAVEKLIDNINPQSTAKKVDAVYFEINNRIKEMTKIYSSEKNKFEQTELAPLKEKLAKKKQEREEFLKG